MIPSRPLGAWRTGRLTGSASAVSTGVDSGSPADRTRRRGRARGRRARTALGRATAEQHQVRVDGDSNLGRHRFRLEPALEVVGHGRAAFALAPNGPAYSYAGRMAVRPAPHARFEGGLDLVAPVAPGARASTTRVVRTRPREAGDSAPCAVRARRGPDRGDLRHADAARGRRRGSRRRRARPHRGRARRHRASLITQSAGAAGSGRLPNRRARPRGRAPGQGPRPSTESRTAAVRWARSGADRRRRACPWRSEVATYQPPRVRSVVQKAAQVSCTRRGSGSRTGRSSGRSHRARCSGRA